MCEANTQSEKECVLCSRSSMSDHRTADGESTCFKHCVCVCVCVFPLKRLFMSNDMFVCVCVCVICSRYVRHSKHTPPHQLNSCYSHSDSSVKVVWSQCTWCIINACWHPIDRLHSEVDWDACGQILCAVCTWVKNTLKDRPLDWHHLFQLKYLQTLFTIRHFLELLSEKKQMNSGSFFNTHADL